VGGQKLFDIVISELGSILLMVLDKILQNPDENSLDLARHDFT
jgi:hypothetical protein